MNNRTVEFKLYLNVEQQQTLDRWFRVCCRTYNNALAERIKIYRETGKSVDYFNQQMGLTKQRKIDAELEDVPIWFARDALRRVDRGMKAFFRRCQSGAKKPGFPRFRPEQRYNSIEFAWSYKFVRLKHIFIPKLGEINARGAFELIPDGKQKLLRIIRRANGWYAQVLIEVSKEFLPSTGQDCGLDLGLESFLTFDSGEKVDNPRLLRKAARRLRSAQKTLSRRVKGSRRRAKAKRIVARTYEKIVRQRKGFCHRVSRDLVNRFDRIAHEDLNIIGLARGRLSKSILDAAWGLFIFYLTYKAESAGRVIVKVDPKGTSQECPKCGLIKPKLLSERVHSCSCGCLMPRDQASGIVIKHRAFGRGRGDLVRPLTVAGSMKRNGALQA